MPRYFFDVSGGDLEVDHVGVKYPDDDVAREEAVRLAGAMLREQPQLVWGSSWRLTVRDDRERQVFALTFHGDMTPKTLQAQNVIYAGSRFSPAESLAVAQR